MGRLVHSLGTRALGDDRGTKWKKTQIPASPCEAEKAADWEHPPRSGFRVSEISFFCGWTIIHFCICWHNLSVKSLQLCSTLCDPMDCSPPGSSVPGDSPDKNTGMGCHALLQAFFLTQGSNPGLLCLLHWQVGSLPPALPGQP